MKYYLLIFLLSLLPITELRGALPLAIISYHLNFWYSFMFSVLGSFLGGVIILLLLKYLEKLIDQSKYLKKIKEKIYKHTRSKQAQRFKRLQEGLIFILAAVPIPILGGSYTAALVAYLFNASRIKSLIYIFLGLTIQGIAIAFLSKLI